MTVDPKLTSLLVFILLVMAAPVAAHHKEGHAQGNPDENAQQGPDTQGGDRDGSQDQARGPPDHAKGDQHAQTSLPGEETSTEEEDQEDADATGSTDESTETEEEQASEDGSTTDDPDDGEDAEELEDTTVPEEDPTPTSDTQDADEDLSQDTTETTLEPAPDVTAVPEPGPGTDEDDGISAPEPATDATEDQAGSQDAFTARLSPTTGQPLSSNGLDGDQASQDQGPGVQAPVSQAPGWDLAPLILIGLAALTGGGMATLRRSKSPPGQAQTSSAPTPGPTAATESSEATGTSRPGAEPSLPPGAPALLELAQESVRREDLEGAIGWFEAAIALQPDLPVAHLCLGVCLAGLDRDEEALESLGHAAQLAPGDPVPVYHQARILARMGRSQEALDHLARVVPVLPYEMVETLAEDEAFSSLADHPRFLALTGRL